MDIEQLKKKLEGEKASLEGELASVGRINPDNKDDWEPVAAALNIDQAEIEERASEITDFEERSAIEFEFEKRYNEVRRALAKITDGTYGNCEKCGGAIEPARLDANPAAEMCIAHMN